MSIFDRFESAVERGVNGAFSRVFRSGIKPVDITTAIRRAMDESVQEVSASRIIAANHFSVYASRAAKTGAQRPDSSTRQSAAASARERDRFMAVSFYCVGITS